MNREAMLAAMETEGIRNEEVIAACVALGDTALSDEAVTYIFNKRTERGE